MNNATVNVGVVIFVWVTLAYKLHTLRWRPQDTVQRANCLTHGMIALTFTVLSPPVYIAIDQLVGIPNAARLLGNCFGVVGGWFFRPIAAQLAPSGRKGKLLTFLDSGWLPALTIAALVALFNRASLPISAPLDFQSRYSTAPFMAPYRLVLMLYVGLVSGRVLLLSIRNRAIVERNPRPYRRAQTNLQTVGWGLCVGYAVQECVYIALGLLGLVPPQSYPVALANITLIGGIVLLLSNALFDGWHWLGQYRTHRRLYPLWRDLHAATPSIALDPPRSPLADALTLSDIGLRLYRRVIEIHDGFNALRPYTGAGVTAQDHDATHNGHAERRDTAPAVAAVLRKAVDAKLSGRTTTGATGGQLIPSHDSFDEEVRMLERIATAYRRVASHREYVPNRRTGEAL